ncbi:MAG: flagellar basal body-associated FliL family protein [Pseudomonadota bacterium]
MAKKDKGGKKKKDEAEDAGEEEAKGGKGKLIIIIVVALLVLGGGGGGAAFFLLGGKDESATAAAEDGETPEDKAAAEIASKGEPRYVDLDPDFTVNMDASDNRRFVQIAVSLLTYYEATEDAIKENIPIIRNNIILMVGRKTSDELATAAGKEQLQNEIHDEVIRVLEENSAGVVAEIERVFFTKFVMQ